MLEGKPFYSVKSKLCWFFPSNRFLNGATKMRDKNFIDSQEMSDHLTIYLPSYNIEESCLHCEVTT